MAVDPFINFVFVFVLLQIKCSFRVKQLKNIKKYICIHKIYFFKIFCLNLLVLQLKKVQIDYLMTNHLLSIYLIIRDSWSLVLDKTLRYTLSLHNGFRVINFRCYPNVNISGVGWGGICYEEE